MRGASGRRVGRRRRRQEIPVPEPRPPERLQVPASSLPLEHRLGHDGADGRRVLEAVAAPPEVGVKALVLGDGTEDGLVIRGHVVDARVPAHRQPVLHDREAVGDQLGVPHDLLGVGALVVLVGVDHLLVRGEADDRQVAGLGPHVRPAGPVDHPGMPVEAGRAPEEAHLVALRSDGHGDAERREERRRPEPRADDHGRRVDLPRCRADARHAAAGHEEGLDRNVLDDGGAELTGARRERVRRRGGVRVAGLRLVGGHGQVVHRHRGHQRLQLAGGQEVDPHAERARPPDVLGEVGRPVGPGEPEDSDLAEARVAAADLVGPPLEAMRRGVRGSREEVHGVEAADQRRGPARGPGREELPLHEHHPPRAPVGQMVGDARSVDSASDDDDIGRARHLCHANLAPFGGGSGLIAPGS